MNKRKFFITTTVPITLGFFVGQCRNLKDIYDIRAISTDNELLKIFGEQEEIPVIGLNMEREISLFQDLVALVKWIWLLLRERPYVVHANTPKASLLAMIAAWLTFRPVRIYMCHGLRYQGCIGMKRKVLMTMERISCFCANRVICVSKGVREQFAEDKICSLNKSKVILYGSVNGVDTERFNPVIVDDFAVKTQYGIKDDDLVCIFVGRMVRDKGVEELVDVITLLHKAGLPVKLLIVGGREEGLDTLSTHTEKQIKDADYIIECGRQSDVRAFIKASKLLVLPSYREGFGQVLVEANSLGIPVIASKIIGCKNVINEGVNGLLCEPRDKVTLYDCILSLFTDKELYNSIKSQCRQYTIDHFDRKMVTKAYINFYTSLL